MFDDLLPDVRVTNTADAYCSDYSPGWHWRGRTGGDVPAQAHTAIRRPRPAPGSRSPRGSGRRRSLLLDLLFAGFVAVQVPFCSVATTTSRHRRLTYSTTAAGILALAAVTVLTLLVIAVVVRKIDRPRAVIAHSAASYWVRCAR
ncbi:DUF4173 domain-containing protein [Rhodococcus hoagii]|nr:DUF4173 domain-containing protein [Prescottella equi]